MFGLIKKELYFLKDSLMILIASMIVIGVLYVRRIFLHFRCGSGHGISLLGGVKLGTAFGAGDELFLFFHYVPSPVGLSIPASQTGQRREF